MKDREMGQNHKKNQRARHVNAARGRLQNLRAASSTRVGEGQASGIKGEGRGTQVVGPSYLLPINKLRLAAGEWGTSKVLEGRRGGRMQEKITAGAETAGWADPGLLAATETQNAERRCGRSAKRLHGVLLRKCSSRGRGPEKENLGFRGGRFTARQEPEWGVCAGPAHTGWAGGIARRQSSARAAMLSAQRSDQRHWPVSQLFTAALFRPTGRFSPWGSRSATLRGLS